jgi:hypothetical protein
VKFRHLLCISVIAFAACKNKDQPSNTTADKGSGSSAPVPVPTPSRAPGKLTAAELNVISEVKFDGYRRATMDVSDNRATVRQYRERKGTTLAMFTTITVNPCQDCTPMELPKWQAKEKSLKAITLDPAIMETAKYELGETTVAGKKMISGYQLGQAETTYTNAFQLWFNDGVNEIWIISQYGDNQMVNAEGMAQAMPKAELEGIATMMMAEYLKKL